MTGCVKQDDFTQKFMDDIIILAPTRLKLQNAIKTINQALESLRLKQHPDKTFIGRISRGFDFLGYQFESSGLFPAPKTLEKVC